MNRKTYYPCSVLIRAVVLSQLIIVVAALLLAGILFQSTNEFMAIFSFDMNVLAIGLIVGAVCVAADLLLMKILPEQAFYDGGINERLFTCLQPIQIFFLTLLIAFSEELLFRGVLQTHTGFVLASIVFIAVHVRYLKNTYLLINVTILSFLLGYVYESTESLWSVFIIHFIIDYILGIYIHYSNKEGV